MSPQEQHSLMNLGMGMPLVGEGDSQGSALLGTMPVTGFFPWCPPDF